MGVHIDKTGCEPVSLGINHSHICIFSTRSAGAGSRRGNVCNQAVDDQHVGHVRRRVIARDDRGCHKEDIGMSVGRRWGARRSREVRHGGREGRVEAYIQWVGGRRDMYRW